jgi:ribonuclease BN (tRNA processing enzyme)
MIKGLRSFVLSSMVVLAAPAAVVAQGCAPGPATVQVLGSGGPAVSPERASTSYLLWIDGQAKMLVDMGGGAFFRFGQSGAKLSDLSMVAISHLHPDHVSDLPALLWLSNRDRQKPLPIIGPSGNNAAPSFSTFLSRLFDEQNGAFQVLGSTLGGTQAYAGTGVRLEVEVVDAMEAEPSMVFDRMA